MNEIVQKPLKAMILDIEGFYVIFSNELFIESIFPYYHFFNSTTTLSTDNLGEVTDMYMYM